MSNQRVKQIWEKKGLIITPDLGLWWMQSFAMIPVADHIEGDLFRIFFSGRDSSNRSHIGFVIAKVADGIISILEKPTEPVLTIGELGTFDDNGVTPSWIANDGTRKYLYYIGWNAGSTTRMSLIAGLAVSNDGGNSFVRNSRAPLLHRTDREPFAILTAPCVVKIQDKWKMWYVSGEGWINRDLPKYNIKYAESEDGVNWERNGHVCLELNPNETALARPCVLEEDGIYRMWFSYKDPLIGYRIGYAESYDGKKWIRYDDEAAMDPSTEGWDSEMIEYSFVFKHKNILYMLYNGNGYGINGAGYAVCHTNKSEKAI
jgi:hypothetical protein